MSTILESVTAENPGRQTLEARSERLSERLRQLQPLIVAFSGGVDSAFLAHRAHQVLGDNALAVTSDSETVPSNQRRIAMEFAHRYKLRHEIIYTREMEMEGFRSNPNNRCYYCKTELYSSLIEMAQERGFRSVVDGANFDDLGDYRPGHQAAAEHGVLHPLVECRLTKADIRELSRRAGLPTWDQPASACLSSRVPYGSPITIEKLTSIDQGEEAMRQLGFRVFRVRHHGDVVRLEIAPDELSRAFDKTVYVELVRCFKALGFKYVTLDLEGYRSGSLNEAIGK